MLALEIRDGRRASVGGAGQSDNNSKTTNERASGLVRVGKEANNRRWKKRELCGVKYGATG